MNGGSGPRRVRIPSMTDLLAAAEARPVLRGEPRVLVRDALRAVTQTARAAACLTSEDNAGGTSIDSVAPSIGDGSNPHPGPLPKREREQDEGGMSALLDAAESWLRIWRTQRLRPVINATGIVLHTGLGRGVLADEAVRRIAEAAAGYCNLEIDLDSGDRGRRGQYAERLLCQLTGAEAGLVVNNNAAATLLTLHGLAAGREVIVSRGQLIEIGGSFRLPEIMTAGGAVLREVGTTNKTRLADFQAAIGDRTAAIMRVHTSNFRVVGFTESPGAAELAALSRSWRLPFIDDLGSGALVEDSLWRAAEEPTVSDSLRAGADLVLFSGDKLLGGPQAGILLGRRELIERLRESPMARAMRVDKLTIAALEATLELYLSPETVTRSVPTLAMLAESETALDERAASLAACLRKAQPNERFAVAKEMSYAGGGSLPAWPLPTAVVRWEAGGGGRATRLARRLRMGAPAVLARIREDAVVFDVRTLSAADFAAISTACLKGVA